MSDKKPKIRSLIIYFGGRKEMAKALDISYSHVGHLLLGRRGMSPALAARVEQKTNRLFTRQELIW